MKRNFEKMMAEYSKNANEQTRRAFTFGDYGDIVNFAEDKYRREDGDGYLVRIHPSLLVCIAFQIGYAYALRNVKADESKRRRANRQEMLDDLMRKYSETFSEGFPSFQVFRGRKTQECIDLVQRCLKEHKDAYELGYATDEKEVLCQYSTRKEKSWKRNFILFRKPQKSCGCMSKQSMPGYDPGS